MNATTTAMPRNPAFYAFFPAAAVARRLARLFARGLCACGCTEADHGPVSFRPCNACRCFAWRPSHEACRWYTRRAEQGDYRSVHPLHGGAFAQ